jgi:DNA polymerase-3 subunit epsilon
MWNLRLRRLAYSRRVKSTALQAAWKLPLPRGGADWREISFLVCDGEMSSMELANGELLSLGWVCVERGAYSLDTAQHHLIQASETVGQSATIHQLRDCELSDAESGEKVLEYFLAAAAGKVLVFHHAALDMAFLNQLSLRYYDAPLLMPVVDTLRLEERLMERRQVSILPGSLRLHACRDRYHLPVYPAHNALLDAMATAELLIAHTRHRGGNEHLKLGDLL